MILVAKTRYFLDAVWLGWLFKILLLARICFCWSVVRGGELPKVSGRLGPLRPTGSKGSFHPQLPPSPSIYHLSMCINTPEAQKLGKYEDSEKYCGDSGKYWGDLAKSMTMTIEKDSIPLQYHLSIQVSPIPLFIRWKFRGSKRCMNSILLATVSILYHNFCILRVCL